MATNLVNYTNVINIPVAGASSGDPVLVGRIWGVALNDTDADGNVDVRLPAMYYIYDLSVKAVDGSGNKAVAVGDEIFYVPADTPKLSKKVSGTHFGYSLETITAGSTDTINILISP